jgi:hypothetical protein
MRINCSLLACALAMVGGITCLAQTKTWTGAGDGVSWTNRFNWSGSTLPAASDTVGITSGSGTRVIIFSDNDITVRSIQCSKPLVVSGGSLTLTAGSSSFSGALTLSNSATLTAAGAVMTASGTTVLADSWLSASGGGVMHFPNLYSVTNNNASPVWRADDASSLIDLSMVTNISMSTYQDLYLEAYTGGKVDLHGAITCTGSVQVDTTDSGSVVDFSGLTGRWKSIGNHALSFSAATGGSVLIPKVTQLENASLEVDDTGIIPTAQLNLLTNCTLTVGGGAAPSFGQVTNINDTWVYAKGGGIARLTNVFRVTHTNQSPTWRTDDAGSLIDLSMVTNLTMGYYQDLYAEAYTGGKVDLHRVTSCTGSVQADTTDSGSVINLSSLTGRWKSTANHELSLSAATGGSILIPGVTQLENASLEVDDTGIIPTAQLNQLTNCSLTVGGGAAPNFGLVTNINDSWVYAKGGGVARLTNVFRVMNNNQSPTWRADDAGSLIDLSKVTSISMSYYQDLYAEAYTGGKVDLHGVTTCTGSVQADTTDSGSVINLSGLTGRWKSVNNHELSLSAATGGSILIPGVTQLENASLEVDTTGTISTAQLNLLTNCTLTVNAAKPSFVSLTNIDDTWVYAYGGGAARLTNVLWVTCGNQSPRWHAEGSGSLIDLSQVIDVLVGYYQDVYVEAYSGGKVDLHRVVSLCTSSVQVTSDGSGSKVDLSGLTGFISTGNHSSSLTARNGGVILLGTQAFLLGNVDINIPAGNPVLPPTVVATGGLTLYGQAWHSYWVDKRDTTSESNPWVFLARVPLTNSLQLFAGAPAPNTEYQVSEFVADPPILDLFLAANSHFLMVVYDTPNKTNQLYKTSSLANGTTWSADVVNSMTNAFRFVSITNSNPVRFFRAKRL